MHDKVKVVLASGKGGDGAIAFRREKSVEKGGPYGGNGGKGGSIFLVADNGVESLQEYRFGKVVKAEPGENGKTKLQYGKDAKDIYLRVPCGTVVEDEEGKQLADLIHHGDTYLAVKGGRGGRGNATFKSPTRRTPNIAENGMPGEEKTFYFELKLLADVGLVGYPNVGKSTLLSAVTRANAQVGNYEFTTLEPQLGVCFVEPDKSFVLADLPGLIDGASSGKGLGYTFLRHIERCRVLLHIIDVTRDANPYQDFVAINNELYSYSDKMKKKKMIVALNKTDVSGFETATKELKDKLTAEGYDVFCISAKESKNLKSLMRKLYKIVSDSKKAERENAEEKDNEEVVYSAKNMDRGRKPIYQIVKREDGYFEILGERVVRTKRLINLKTDEGVDRLLAYLDSIEIDKALQEAGAKNGDTVLLDDYEFEYFD